MYIAYLSFYFVGDLKNIYQLLKNYIIRMKLGIKLM